MVWVIYCLLLSIINSTESDNDPSSNANLVKEVNQKAKCWKASLKSSLLLKTKGDFEQRLGAIPKETAVGGRGHGNRPADLDKDVKLPKNFDARKRWPECPSIGKIVDQGPCGGCWATAATSVAADRYCIQNIGQDNPPFSYADVLTCSNAGSCSGGSSVGAYEYMIKKGVPSGAMRDEKNWGNWKQTCCPSPFELCNHHQEGTHEICPDSKTLEEPKCKPKCREESKQDYNKDRWYGEKHWDLNSAQDIMRELYYRGPVSIAFRVYKDFYFYMNGVYETVAGEDIGLHATKLIGWGYDEECGLDYWIIPNSWDPDWGENGFIRVKKEPGYMGIGTSGAEGFSMKIPPKLQANVAQLRALKEAREAKLRNLEEEDLTLFSEKEQEHEVGFLVWSAVAPRNITFALSTLGVFTTAYVILSIYHTLKRSCTKKRKEEIQRYQAVNQGISVAENTER